MGNQAASATPEAEVPWGGTAVVLSSWQRGTGLLKKPRAAGWFGTRFFISAANSWPFPEPGTNEKAEMCSWTFHEHRMGVLGFAVRPPQQGADSLSLVLFPAAFFSLQGARGCRKRVGEAPNGSSRRASQSWSLENTQSLPCLASAHGARGPQ